MKSHRIAPASPALALCKRCAIFTRKSTDEGLDQDYNSFEARLDAGIAFVASQRHEGWMCGSAARWKPSSTSSTVRCTSLPLNARWHERDGDELGQLSRKIQSIWKAQVSYL